MKRYYFNVREGDDVFVDDVGLELASKELAWAEAARSVAELGRDQIVDHPEGHRIVIEVRIVDEPVMAVHLSFQTIWGSIVPTKSDSSSTEKIRRLLDAFSLVDPETKMEILTLAEKLSGLASKNEGDETKHR